MEPASKLNHVPFGFGARMCIGYRWVLVVGVEVLLSTPTGQIIAGGSGRWQVGPQRSHARTPNPYPGLTRPSPPLAPPPRPPQVCHQKRVLTSVYVSYSIFPTPFFLRFAIMEAKMALARLYHEFRFKLRDPGPMQVRGWSGTGKDICSNLHMLIRLRSASRRLKLTSAARGLRWGATGDGCFRLNHNVTHMLVRLWSASRRLPKCSVWVEIGSNSRWVFQAHS